MVSIIRREQAAAAGEERRRVLLEVKNDADTPEAAELVEVNGRQPEHKNGERLRGAYMRIESDKVPIAYQKLEFDTGKLDEKGPFLILELGKKNRWKFIDKPEGEGKGFAHNPMSDTYCPTLLQSPWFCYDGKENGYNEDCALSIKAIPLGFFPVSPPRGRELGKEITELEGPAKGTLIKVWSETDESQIRKVSPRLEITLPKKAKQQPFTSKKIFDRCRVRWLDESTKDFIWGTYKKVRDELMCQIEETFFFFVAAPRGCKTVWYNKEDDCCTAAEVSEAHAAAMEAVRTTKPHLVDPSREKDLEEEKLHNVYPHEEEFAEVQTNRRTTTLALHNEEPLQMDLEEDTEGEQLNSAPKRRRLGSVQIHGVTNIATAEDPWMELVGRTVAEQRPKNWQAAVDNHKASCSSLRTSGSESVRPGVSDASDFIKLAKGDLTACQRVVADAQEQPWFQHISSFEAEHLANAFKEITECQRELAWSWVLAVGQLGQKAPSMNICGVLNALVTSTLRGSCERLCLTFARLLIVCQVLHERAMSLFSMDDMLSVIIHALQQEMIEAESVGEEEFAAAKCLAKLGFSPHVAQQVFRSKRNGAITMPSGRTCWHSILVVASFGVLLATRLRRKARHTDLGMQQLRDRLLKGNVGNSGIAPWRRLCSFYIGYMWQANEHEAAVAHLRNLLEELVPAVDAKQLASMRELLHLAEQSSLRKALEGTMQASVAKKTSEVKQLTDPAARSELGASQAISPQQTQTTHENENSSALPEKFRAASETQWTQALNEAVAVLRTPESSTHSRQSSDARSLFDQAFPSEHSLCKRIDAAIQSCTHDRLWLLFSCAEEFRRAAECPPLGSTMQSIRKNLIHAFHIHRGLGTTLSVPTIPRAASLLMLAQLRASLDRLENTVHRAPEIAADKKNAHALLTGVTPAEFSRVLKAALQRPYTTPLQQPSCTASVTQLPQSNSSGASSDLSGPQSLDATTKPPASGRPGAASAAVPGISSETALHANGPPRIRSVSISDLRPGVETPWMMNALVLDKMLYRTGTGFRATLQDPDGQKIVAHFFRESARMHSPAIRIGDSSRIIARSRKTFIEVVPPQYGGGFQIVVGIDAELIKLDEMGGPPRLGRLPPVGCRVEEILAVVLDPGELGLASNGAPYRRVLLSDETCDARGVYWASFDSVATNVPDTLSRGAVVRLRGAFLKEWNGRKQLQSSRNGELAVVGSELLRAKELTNWWASRPGILTIL